MPYMVQPVQMLTCPEAAKELGVSADTVRRWVKAGTIAHVVWPGSRPRIPRAEVNRLLKAKASR